MRVDEFERAAVPRTTTGGVVESAGASRATVPHVSNAFIARAAGDKVRINLPRGTTVDGRTELTFRLTSLIPVTNDAAIERAALPDWEMRVVTASGTTSARPNALDRRGIRAPNRPFLHQVYERDEHNNVIGTANVTKNQFDTLSIPLSAFRIARGADVQAVEFEARGGTFPLILDSIAFV